jgi:quercetin dioxygenase-like cupin family protein
MNELMKKGEAVDLASLADYAESSVVSRELLEKENGGLTLFAFAKGRRLSERSAPFDACVQVLEGRAETSIGGEWRDVLEGQFIVMPANIPHAARAPEDFKMPLTMIRS